LDIILPMTCGQPKIEVTFEIDASGLLTEVAAIEKSSGSNQNTIAANDNGSLSQDEIDSDYILRIPPVTNPLEESRRII